MAAAKQKPAIEVRSRVAAQVPQDADAFVRRQSAPSVERQAVDVGPAEASEEPVQAEVERAPSSEQPPASGGQRAEATGQRPKANRQPLKGKRRGMVARADGKQLAQFTVYLDPEDGMRLKRHCLEEGLVVSEECARILTAWIRRLPSR